MFGYMGADFAVVRRHFERRVYKKAATPFFVGERALDRAEEKCPDRRLGRQRVLERAASPSGFIEIVVERPTEERAFVGKGVIEAGAGDRHAGGEVAHGGRLVAGLPETGDRLVENRGLVKLALPRHCSGSPPA